MAASQERTAAAWTRACATLWCCHVQALQKQCTFVLWAIYRRPLLDSLVPPGCAPLGVSLVPRGMGLWVGVVRFGMQYSWRLRGC